MQTRSHLEVGNPKTEVPTDMQRAVCPHPFPVRQWLFTDSEVGKMTDNGVEVRACEL